MTKTKVDKRIVNETLDELKRDLGRKNPDVLALMRQAMHDILTVSGFNISTMNMDDNLCMIVSPAAQPELDDDVKRGFIQFIELAGADEDEALHAMLNLD